MQVKRFVASDMRQALKAVRESLGPDAVILSNRRTPEGVEIHASCEVAAERSEPATASTQTAAAPAEQGRDSFLARELERMQHQARSRARELSQKLAKEKQEKQEGEQPRKPRVKIEDVEPQQSVVSVAESPEFLRMRDELQQMRDMMEEQFSALAATQTQGSDDPRQAVMLQRLQRLGVQGAGARQLCRDLPQAGGLSAIWNGVVKDLISSLPTVGYDMVARGGNFAMVGPTGAGKTTTIGKLAARYVLENGPDSVALVTMDSYRIAAHEQLRTLGRILNVPVKVVGRRQSLRQVMRSLRDKDLVLVDTAGLNHQDPALREQLDALNEMGQQLKTLQVLPSTSQREVLKANHHSYRTNNLVGCVVTKLDETASLGESISLILDTRMPLAYTTDGQGIPNDLNVADSHKLVRQAVAMVKKQAQQQQAV